MNRINASIVCCGLLLALGQPAFGEDQARNCDPEPTEMGVAYGDIVACEIGVIADTDIFRFPGVIDELVRIRIARVGTFSLFEPCIKLFEPNGNLLGEGCNFTASNEIQIPLGVTGTFTMTVSDLFTNGTGEYHLTLVRIAPPSSRSLLTKYGDNLSGMVGPVVDMDPYLLRGSKGDNLRVEIARVGKFTLFEPCIELFDSDGGLLGTGCNFTASNLIEVVLPETDDYTILVSDLFTNGFGEFNLGLQCVVGPCVSTPKCAGSKATLVGTSGDNIITGTDGRDVIVAGAGNDTVYGLGGRDVICGGSGDDTLYGGSSGDNLRGNAGNDIVIGNGGNDVLRGGSGNDVLLGEAGNDVLRGQNGNDSLAGGSGDDRLDGGAGHDVCDGTAGVNTDGGQCEQLVNIP